MHSLLSISDKGSINHGSECDAILGCDAKSLFNRVEPDRGRLSMKTGMMELIVLFCCDW